MAQSQKVGSGFTSGPPPANGGEVGIAGPQRRDPFGYPVPGGSTVVPKPGGAVGPQPAPPVTPDPRSV